MAITMDSENQALESVLSYIFPHSIDSDSVRVPLCKTVVLEIPVELIGRKKLSTFSHT